MKILGSCVFQRPICISFVSSHRPSALVLSRFSFLLRRILSPLLLCNRRLFLSLISKLVTISDDLEKGIARKDTHRRDTPIIADLSHEYYTLYRPEVLEDSKKQIDAVAEQVFNHCCFWEYFVCEMFRLENSVLVWR